MELALIGELIVGGVGLVILFNVSIHLLNKHIHNSISKLIIMEVKYDELD